MIFGPPGGGGSGNPADIVLNRNDNPNASSTVLPFVAFADAAGTAPVDGTGGAPTVTIARSTSSPLEETSTFLFTKTAANSQGQGFSADLTLQPDDATKVFTLSFDYQITTGTYTGYQALPSFSDLTLWVYDVTNSVMYQITPFQLDGTVSSTNQYSFQGSWQVPVGCLSARVIWFIGNTGASAFTAKFNNISFGRMPRAQGVATSSGSYTPTITGVGTAASVSFNYSQVGGRLWINGDFTTGTVAATVCTFSLPAGFQIDTTVMGASFAYYLGNYTRDIANASNEGTLLAIPGLTTTQVFFGGRVGQAETGMTAFQGVGIFNNNEDESVFASIPIANQKMAILGQDADTRILACRYSVGSTQFINQNIPGNYNTKVYDTFGGVTTSTTAWRMYSPIASFWQLSLQFITATTGSPNVLLYKNGVLDQYLFTVPSSGVVGAGSALVFLRAGDYIDIRTDTGGSTFRMSSAGATTGDVNIFSAFAVPGPAQIQASEIITARYSTNAGQSISNNSVTIVDYEDVTFDDHGCVTTGVAWKFTCPRSGKVKVSAKASFASNAGWAVGETAYLAIFKTGVEYSRGPFDSPVTATIVVNLAVDDEISVLAGDTIDIRIFQLSGGTIALDSTAVKNTVNISYVGGFG